MDFGTKCSFAEKDNSLLVAALLKSNDRKNFTLESSLPHDALTDNLGIISGLYIYTNTPPHGYGSQGPKVAETVQRAYSYNLKKSNKVIKIGDYEIERLNWEEEEDGDFPFDETHGNFLAKDLRLMSQNFLKANVSLIDSCVNSTIEKTLHSNSDILTKGRQTLDCFTHQSVTASVAYKRMYDFYKSNLGTGSLSCFEWIRSYFLMLGKQEMRCKAIKETTVRKNVYNRVLKIRAMKEVKSKKIITKRITGNRLVRKNMMDYSRSFASYIKHKERGKLNRRAIASANMILRMFLYIIEEFHLSLGKVIQGSTISIGGEEKKAKIINNLADAVLPMAIESIDIQGTEDATKWNECLSPAAFAIMHKTFFDEDIRKKLGLPKPSEYGRLFQEMALSGHFIMAIKRIQMGPGPIATSTHCYNRLDWKTTPLKRFNKKTREWLENIRPKIDEENYLNASPGMLMGMLNAGSTTLGLLAPGYCLEQTSQAVKTLRSSDDSTTVYVASDVEKLKHAVETNRRALAAIGINLSLEKTFFFNKNYSEYTSWYQDQGFVSQFGVETSAIRPQGKNPPDDFYSIAKGTATGLTTLTLNHIGATMRLILGIDGVRRIWRIKREPGKREGISSRVQLLSDGGDNLWHSANCHLEEISLKERFIVSVEEIDYLLRVCNPNNPFSPDPSEEISYSKEVGRLVTTEVETPRTVFHYMKRSNRTVTNTLKKDMFDQEKINASASKIVKAIIPTTLIRYPTDSSKISNQLLAALSIQRSRVDLTPEQEAEFNRCVARLTGNIKASQHKDSDEEYTEEWD